MSAKKTLVSLLVAAGMIGAVALPMSSASAQDVIYIMTAPPPMRAEVVQVQPAGYMWAPGYWDYRGNNYVWVDGERMRVVDGYTYRQHRWVERDGRWSREQARWDRTTKSVNP